MLQTACPAVAALPCLFQEDRRAGAARLQRFVDANSLPTPYLAIDLQAVVTKYSQLVSLMPGVVVYYAVKANPMPLVLDALNLVGAHFDVASAEEVALCLSRGIPAHRLSFGNTIKKPSAIEAAHGSGVATFSFDSESELRKIARFAPGSRVSVRLLTSGDGAEWPLSKKFGCDAGMAMDLMQLARRLDVIPYGVSFHVGSQQTDPRQWNEPIAIAARLFTRLAAFGIRLQTLNLGGGLPARYRKEIPPLDHYADFIHASVLRHFGHCPPCLAIEPGRCLVAEAGLIETEVVLISRKTAAGPRWVHVDCGKFGGLAETTGEAIQYPLRVVGRSERQGPVILAGPTCDSADILYEHSPCELPLDLQEGDRIQIFSAGAYTHTYASVGFNGFPPLQAVSI